MESGSLGFFFFPLTSWENFRDVKYDGSWSSGQSKGNVCLSLEGSQCHGLSVDNCFLIFEG